MADDDDVPAGIEREVVADLRVRAAEEVPKTSADPAGLSAPTTTSAMPLCERVECIGRRREIQGRLPPVNQALPVPSTTTPLALAPPRKVE